MSDLLVIVPSRGRPESVARVVEAWQDTDAFENASLLFVVDHDDPTMPDYAKAINAARLQGFGEILRNTIYIWKPLVPKLNVAALNYANLRPYLSFMGDDHLPRTRGWAGRYLETLREMGTGIVYGNDLLQGERLCTQWAMTSDIVRALGRMVPAPVEHMYCDNSVMDVGRLAGCLRYLPDVVVEHCHPLAGKAEWDTGYARVNRAEQFERDEAAYARWIALGRDADVGVVKALMSDGSEVPDGPVRD